MFLIIEGANFRDVGGNSFQQFTFKLMYSYTQCSSRVYKKASTGSDYYLMIVEKFPLIDKERKN